MIKLVAQPRIINAQAAASREAFAIRITLEAMQHLAQAYAAVPGRKALIWATGSFPFLMHDQTEMSYGGLSPDVYQRTFQMLDDANIAAYPVDIRGLSPGSDDYDANRPRDMSRSIATRAQTLRASEMPNPESVRELSLSTLRSFADMTGGQAFYNANDLQQSMNRLNTTQQQLSSGKKINQPSDDPYGTSQALGRRAIRLPGSMRLARSPTPITISIGVPWRHGAALPRVYRQTWACTGVGKCAGCTRQQMRRHCGSVYSSCRRGAIPIG